MREVNYVKQPGEKGMYLTRIIIFLMAIATTLAFSSSVEAALDHPVLFVHGINSNSTTWGAVTCDGQEFRFRRVIPHRR